jgi:hypothetical protein
MRVSNRFIMAAIAFSALASGCANYKPLPPLIGGFMSPQVSRTSCIDSVAREFKVPKESVKPLSDAQTMQDGFYVVTLSIGPGQPNVNCTVNENGVVSDVIRAR